MLTPKRFELYEAVRRRGGFPSIEALAAEVERNRATVSRDVTVLAGAGLLVLRDSASPVQGRRMEVVLVVERLKRNQSSERGRES